MQGYKVAVIGAGASGMMAAITAARAYPQQVILIEKEARVGKKLLATGNGRCNLLNLQGSESAYHGSGRQVAGSLLKRMPPAWLLSHFRQMGLLIREEAKGRCYPYSGQASAVLDVLRAACEREAVKTCCQMRVTDITKESGMFALHIHTGECIHAEKVILCFGGKAAPALGADGSGFALAQKMGHTVTPLRPALSPLKLRADAVRGLKGIRAQCRLSLEIAGEILREETGEVLFTEHGLSGVAAMQLARLSGEGLARKKRVYVCVQLIDPKTAAEEMRMRTELFALQPMEMACTGLVHKRICTRLLEAADIPLSAPVNAQNLQALLPFLSCWRLPVTGVMPFANAQVTAGGLSPEEFHPETLESLRTPGLYACGEALDVDGDCGGYNLMWAWVSGIAAAEACTR